MYLKSRLMVALIFALVLTIIPLPELLNEFRPPWVLLLLFYAQAFLPKPPAVIAVVMVGLCMDVLLSTTLGEHAFVLVLTAWLASKKTIRFEFLSIGQQMAFILFYAFFYEGTLLILDAFFGYSYAYSHVFIGSILAMIGWPWVKIVVDSYLFPTYSMKGYSRLK